VAKVNLLQEETGFLSPTTLLTYSLLDVM